MKETLYIIFNGRFPSEKAASIFAAKNAETFGRFLKVILIVPRRFGRVGTNPYEYYNVTKNFEIIYIPTIDLYPFKIFGSIAFLVCYLMFSLFTVLYLLIKSNKNSFFYSNEHLPLLMLSFFRKNTFYEMHDFPSTRVYGYYKILLRRVFWVLIHNRWKSRMAIQYLDVDDKKMICEPNAVGIEDFDIDVTKSGARAELKIPLDKKVVVYTGHLYSWKGADTLAEASIILPEEVMVYFVGGTPGDVASFKKRYSKSNMVFVGHRPHSEIPLWQRASDLLVIPNTAKEDISKYYTSPMKLFEYMASERLIIASKIPSLEEIVGEDEVNFFNPDDSLDLARVIMDSLDRGDDYQYKIKNSREKVENHTWQSRAERILRFAGLIK